MNRKNYPLFENYDFSDCHEITGDELFLINGGTRVENSNEAVANAKEGDTLVRNDGTEVTLTQGDINWAQKQVGSSSSSGTDTSTSQTTTTTTSASSSPTESSNTTGNSSSNNSSSSSSSSGSSSSTSSGSSSTSSSQGTRTNNSVSLTSRDNTGGMDGYTDSGSQRNTSALNDRNAVQKSSDSKATGFFDPQDPTRYITDLDNREALQQAAELLADPNTGCSVTAYGSESGITRNFNNYAEINDYLSGNTSLIAEEKNVKTFVKNIELNPDNYSIEAYQRKAFIAYPWKKGELLTHSLYVITDKTTGEKSTLSFNGAGPMLLVSQGAWGLNTKTDVKSLNSYVDGNNDYDMSLYRSSDGIDVQKTASNIIASINSNTSYMALDHKWDWSNWENCNTALYSTIEKKGLNCSIGSYK